MDDCLVRCVKRMGKNVWGFWNNRFFMFIFGTWLRRKKTRTCVLVLKVGMLYITRMSVHCFKTFKLSNLIN